MISPSQRPLPYNTQHSQQTNIHALGGIRTHNLSRRATKNLRLRPRGHWDRQPLLVAYPKIYALDRAATGTGESLYSEDELGETVLR